jgi:DNA repair protein RecO (recombination protein O)
MAALPAVLQADGQGLLCRACASKTPGSRRRFPLGYGSLEILRIILKTPLSAWRDMPQNEHSQKECARAIEAFLQYNTGLNWSNGAFRRI